MPIRLITFFILMSTITLRAEDAGFFNSGNKPGKSSLEIGKAEVIDGIVEDYLENGIPHQKLHHHDRDQGIYQDEHQSPEGNHPSLILVPSINR